MLHVRIVGAGLIAFATLALAAAPASANLAKCESKLSAAAQKLNVAVGKALSKCSVTTRVKGASAKTGDVCEKNLAKVFNIGGSPGKGMVAKTLNAIDKLFVSGKEVCTADDLRALGHMESGFNAPGTRPQDFLASALVVRAVDLASTEMFANVADLQDSLTALVDLTDCNTQRPNLCTFAANQNPDCRVHSCVLSAISDVSYYQANGGTVPASLQNRVATLKFCQTPSTLLDLPVNLSSDFRAVFGDATRTFVPPPVGAGVNTTICIDQLRVQGWCDCVGDGAPFAPSSCLDARVNNNGGTCSTSGDFCLTDADCPSRGTCSNSGFDACFSNLAGARLPQHCTQPNGNACQDGGSTRCLDARTLGRCHSGTYTGERLQSWGGASTAGDCALISTVSFRILPPAICRNGSAQVLGSCTTVCNGGPCAADGPCLGLGGTQCIDPKGPDQRACTQDDLVPPSPPTTIPLTTGQSSVTVRDMLQTQGTCSLSSVNAGMGCATSADCNGGTCSGVVLVNPPNPNVSRTSAAGAKLSCGAYDSSALSGFRLVGSIPLVNLAVINDAIAEFELDCN